MDNIDLVITEKQKQRSYKNKCRCSKKNWPELNRPGADYAHPELNRPTPELIRLQTELIRPNLSLYGQSELNQPG